MAVSRTFVRGLSTSISSSLLRPSAVAVASSSSSSAVQCKSSTSYLTPISGNSFSTSSKVQKMDSDDPKNIKISKEKMESLIEDHDVGHDMTGGQVGRHTKRTLASFSMVRMV